MKVYLLLILGLMITFLGCSEIKQESPYLTSPKCIQSQSQCEFDTELGKVKVLFDLPLITPEQEFGIYIYADSPVIVTGYLEGKSMYMGKIPLIFTKQGDQKHYRAQTMLGSCSDKQMEWQMKIRIQDETTGQDKEVIVSFVSERP